MAHRMGVATGMTSDTILQRNGQVLASAIPSGAVLLDAANGRYIDLNVSSAAIWELLATPKSVGAICDELRAQFDVAADVCERDVRAALERLIEYHVVHIVN